MSAVVSRSFISRSERIESKPDRFQSYVQFNKRSYAVDTVASGAQFTDISFSGMRLLSRQKNYLKVGDAIEMEFNLPGTKGKLKARATVTRCESEYAFAVHFVHFYDGQNYRKALAQYNEITKRGSLTWLALGVLNWVNDHRQGLAIFFFGLLLSFAAFALIAASSDEVQGKGFRSWGANYPKEWFLDYYKTNK